MAAADHLECTGGFTAPCGKCCGACTCLPEAQRPASKPGLAGRLREDIHTVFQKDPAARSVLEILTCYPGLHATWFHRVAHALWNQGLRYPARLLSHISRWLTGIEIHPGAHIGRRFFIDHGMGVVIGETAEIGNDVLIYKGVVLGGVSLEKAKRHPTIGNGVVIGTNAIVLGPIQVGDNAQIGSGSVVVKPVPACATVVGIPGKVVKINGVRCQLKPDLHHEQLPDVDAESIRRLSDRIGALEAQIEELQAHVEEASRMEKAEVRGWA